MKVIEDPKINFIKPFIKFTLDDIKKSLNANQSFYMIDNMMLTKLRKDMKSNPVIIRHGFHLSKVIMIPGIILEEAIRNLPDEKAFENYYGEMFRILSRDHDLCIVDLEIIYGLLREMTNTQEEALHILVNIAQEAVRTNPTIVDSIKAIKIQSQDVLDNLKRTIFYRGNNAGERFLTIFSLGFLSMYYGPVYIVSEDEKGIYGPYRTFLNNERLLEFVNINDTEEFIKQYQFISYEAVIQSIFNKGHIKREELADFIEKSNRNQSRRILYSLNGEPFYTEVSNKNLAKWISRETIRIKF